MTIESLLDPVRQVLENAPSILKPLTGRRGCPQSMTSYQIANGIYRLDSEMYLNLEADKGIAGPGSVFNLIAKTCVALSAKEEVLISYMSANGIEFEVAGGRITPSHPVIALYRLV